MSGISRREMLRFAAAAAGALPALPIISGCTQPGAARRSIHPSRIAPIGAERVEERFQSLPFESQEIGGLFADRMAINVDGRLLHIDAQRFLEGFVQRHAADDFISTWVGEHAGKFLDAACNSLRYRKNADLLQLVHHVAGTLIASQDEDGYLGTYTVDRRWSDWDVWVHNYDLIGLLSYYELTGDPASLAACRKIADLLDRTFGDAPGQRDILAGGIHMGMADTKVLEPLCTLYRHTGEERYLSLCKYLVRAYERSNGPHVISTLLSDGKIHRVGNAHAYAVMSNLNGIIDLYRLTGDETLLSAVMNGWTDIVRHQIYLTGAVCSFEHFQPDDQLRSLQSSNVGEMCATVTWLQLNWRLLRLTGEARFGHEIERSVYNQLLAAQNPQSGDISYFTSLVGRKEHNDAPLCCVSSGPRGISLIPQLVWGLADNAFVINLYASGQARFEISGVPIEVRSQTQFPLDGDVTLTMTSSRATRFTVRLRVPEWITRFDVEIGSDTFRGAPGQMLDITRTWQRSSTLQIRMDLPTRLLSGGRTYPDYVALQRGPQILALETALNPTLPYLHRAALDDGSAPPVALPVAAPPGWHGTQVYEVDAIAGIPADAGQLRPQQRRLRFVPFADALDYSVWAARTDRLRSDVPAVTAFGRAMYSTHSKKRIAEALTDENPATFCTVDPRDVDFGSVLFGHPESGQRGDPVWFAAVLDDAKAISRIVFRHGPFSAEGGWFDTSQDKPRVEVLRAPVTRLWKLVPDVFSVHWENVATFELYPATDASSVPRFRADRQFEVSLPRAVTVHAIRIIGKPGGDYVSCAELGAYV